MRIVFMGTPGFAVPTLDALAAAGRPAWELVAVVCQPDRPAGRGGVVQPPPVKTAAEGWGLPVYQPARMRQPEAVAWLEAQRPDVLVVVAFGQILPPAVFELPRWGAINAHASLLPSYRGAAPIQWAIANSESRTGVTTMRINAGLDTGDRLLQREIAIPPQATAVELSSELAKVAAGLMIDTLAGLEQGSLVPRPQPAGTFPPAPMLSRQDGDAEWSSPALELYNRWRGFQPWPGLHSHFRGRQLSILSCRADHTAAGGAAAALTHGSGPAMSGELPGTLVRASESSGDLPAVVCGRDRLILHQVRLEGRRAVSGADFARGAHLRWGEERLEHAAGPKASRA